MSSIKAFLPANEINDNEIVRNARQAAHHKSNVKNGRTDIVAIAQNETDDALLLFDGELSAWVPKSQIEDNRDGTWTMPVWLAKDRGFI